MAPGRCSCATPRQTQLTPAGYGPYSAQRIRPGPPSRGVARTSERSCASFFFSIMITELLTFFRRCASRVSLVSCVISIAVLVLSAESSLACVCLPQSPAQELERATAVFSGKVLKVKRHKQSPDVYAFLEVVFRVEEAWKGVNEKTISVFTSSTSLACGFSFKRGLTYLVYAHGKEGRLSTSVCTRTGILEDAYNDLEELGSGKLITKSGSDANGTDVRSLQLTKQLKVTRSNPRSCFRAMLSCV